MNLPDAPIAHEGFFATHFFTVRDQDKSKDFYVRILGGKVIKPENPCYIKLANTWIILNSGGGPTPDKPEVLLEIPSDLNRVNSFLNLRVADIWACYKQWGDKGAFFLTEPIDNHGWEWRCYMRDPDGYLIEVGHILKWSSTVSKTTPVKLPSNFTLIRKPMVPLSPNVRFAR
jgi:catechol 2,3-dioxygenase-like lactoylglutathione lyase family enzyme